MNERVVPKKTNFRVVKLSNSPAKAGPMSEAIALGLTHVPRLELDGPTFRHFESQHDSPRINQWLLKLITRQLLVEFRVSRPLGSEDVYPAVFIETQ
jgi:hypothetical protein